jgi:anti-sigma regulatory factor (Ser/Thr protein kinase)
MLEYHSRFALENDPALIRALVKEAQQAMADIGFGDVLERIRIGEALEEALLNAMYHGNLEVSSELREEGDTIYYQLAEQRCREEPYRQRRVHVEASFSRSEVVFVVRDEGPGFEPARLRDPTDPANLERLSGRGLLLIQTFMDEVLFNETGNQITMTKRKGERGA